jgi:hypothetical protein
MDTIMSDVRLFVGMLCVVAVLPLVVLGAVRLAVRVVPAGFGSTARLERRHYSAYWLLVATLYALLGIGHLVLRSGRPIVGVLFLVAAVANLLCARWRAGRTSSSSPHTGQ